MDAVIDDRDELLRLAAKTLTGARRRRFIAAVTLRLCGGNARQSEVRFGWGRQTVVKGMHEEASGIRCLENFAGRGRKRWEVRHPQLAQDIAALVEPHTQADPELRSSRLYANYSAAELRQALIEQKHYRPEDLPAERTLRSILKRMHYRLRRIQKGKPLKKTPQTDAIFANIDAVKAQCAADPSMLEISMDTKAKVALGEYSRGGKNSEQCGR
jgi:hypothetical protein